MDTQPSHPTPAAAPRAHRLRRRSRLYIPLVLLLILIIVGAIAMRLIQPAVKSEGTPAPASASLTDSERAYYDYVSPRLHKLVGEADQLADLGSKKSRNVLALKSGYEHVTKLIGEIQAYNKQHGVPPRFAQANAEFEQGATTMTTAMSQSEKAFFRFDWNALNAQLAKFKGANIHLRAAMTTLDQAGGVSTPPSR